MIQPMEILMGKNQKGEQKSNILGYIKNEKDIAKYKLETLERIKSPSLSQKRVMEIEREFISLPLEDLFFEDAADVAAAISIYRTSRTQFFNLYKISRDEPAVKNDALLDKKIIYLKNLSHDLKFIKTQEVNYIQNTELYYELIKRQAAKNKNSFEIEKKFLDGKDLSEMLKVEPIVLARKRGRIQAALYSLGEAIASRIKNPCDQKSLDEMVEGLEELIFENYNEALKFLPNFLPGTMGNNPSVSKLHPLQNVLEFHSLEGKLIGLRPIAVANFQSDTPVLGNLLFGKKKVISITQEIDSSRNIRNKVFGILIPLPHEGNEKLSLLYKKIFIDDKDISNMFSSSFSNIKAKHNNELVYCKSLLMKPFWQLSSEVGNSLTFKSIISDLMGISLGDISIVNLNDKNIIDKINNTHSGFINISSNSRVYSAKTRSEEEGISEIIGIIKSKISEIKNDYNLIVER
jgi:predicted DNA-binding ribbon-helix-helix protein